MRFKDLVQELKLANVEISVTDTIPTAGVGYINRRFVIVITKDTTDAERVMFLKHEIGHIMRGDLKKDYKGDPNLWNIANDCHINTETMLKTLKRFPGVDYWELQKDYDELPASHIVSSKEIYEALEKGADIDTPTLDQLLECDGTPSTKEIQEVILAARKAGLVDAQIKSPETVNYKPKKLVNLDELLKSIRGVGGTVQYSRTWTRPNTRTPNIRGAAYQPRPKCCIILDTSGSMSAHLNIMMAAAKDLSLTHDLYYIAHTVNVNYQGNLLPTSLRSGGTMFTPAYKAAAGYNPDVILHFTDGETDDEAKALRLVNCPVYQANPEKHFKPELRK